MHSYKFEVPKGTGLRLIQTLLAEVLECGDHLLMEEFWMRINLLTLIEAGILDERDTHTDLLTNMRSSIGDTNKLSLSPKDKVLVGMSNIKNYVILLNKMEYQDDW